MGHTCELLAQLCDSHWWLNCLLNFASFYFVNFIPGLCPHQRAWVTPMNCLLNFVILTGGWNCLPNFASFFHSVNFIPGLNNLCPHQRAWVTVVSCLLNFASFFISDLSFEIKFVNLKVGQTCPKLSKPVHKTPHDLP